jgi:hypothetical protein
MSIAAVVNGKPVTFEGEPDTPLLWACGVRGLLSACERRSDTLMQRAGERRCGQRDHDD